MLLDVSTRNTPPRDPSGGVVYLRIVLSPQQASSMWVFLNKVFYREGLLATHPTPKLDDHPSSAVRNCLFNTFAATLHIGGRSSIRNLRMRHAVMCQRYIFTIKVFLCNNLYFSIVHNRHATKKQHRMRCFVATAPISTWMRHIVKLDYNAYLVSLLCCSHLLPAMLSHKTLLPQRITPSRWPEIGSAAGYHACYITFATHGRANYSREVSFIFG